MEQLTPQTLLRLTADMPMKQINIPMVGTALDSPSNAINCRYDGDDIYRWEQPYLQRYYAGTFRDGSDLWLHRFLSNDGDRHLHSHPFEFQSVMLCGGYTEEFIDHEGRKKTRKTLPNPSSQLPALLEEFLIGMSSSFPPMSHVFLSLARGSQNDIDVYDWHRIAAVNDDTWTAVIVKPRRLPKWFFKDDNGDISDMRGSSRDWWKNYKTRPDCDIAVGDNHV